MATTRKRAKTTAKTEEQAPVVETAPKKKTTRKKRATKAKPSITSIPPVQVNDADLMWEELRNLPIEMFALPNQRVADHLTRVAGVPNELYLKPNSPAALPSFETLLNGQTIIRVERTAEGDPINVSYPKYEMEETDLYIVVRRFVPPSEKPEYQPVATRQGAAVVMEPKK